MINEKTRLKTSMNSEFIVLELPHTYNIDVFTEKDVLDNNGNLIEKIITVKYDKIKKNEDDLSYEDCMEDEIDNTLDMIKDFISEELLLELEQKLKEKYGV